MEKKLQDQYLDALLESGESVVKLLVGCVVVSCKAGGFYYLGRSGSLRYGITRAGSLPASNKFKQRLLNGEIS